MLFDVRELEVPTTKVKTTSEFGARLYELRLGHNLTQSDLAEILCFSNSSSIANLESGRILPTAKAIVIYCDFFGVTPNWLFGWDEE